MRTYETCLISISGRVSLFSSSSYFSDAAAVRAARQMCKHGELVQVWCGDVCIHNDTIMPKTKRGSEGPASSTGL
jgi:hypothetical protein